MREYMGHAKPEPLNNITWNANTIYPINRANYRKGLLSYRNLSVENNF